MLRRRTPVRRWLSAGLLSLAFVPLPWSCQRRQPAPAAPTPPPPPAINYYELGEAAFTAGNYADAIQSYNTYLRTTPGGPYADGALFRTAMIYSLPESSERNPARATELLGDLILQYPNSPFKQPAELLLRQQAELQAKQSELQLQQLEVERLLADLGSRESQIQSLTQELERLRQVEMEQMRAEVTRREDRIRQLSQELDRLKQIDLQRRPTAPLP